MPAHFYRHVPRTYAEHILLKLEEGGVYTMREIVRGVATEAPDAGKSIARVVAQLVTDGKLTREWRHDGTPTYRYTRRRT